MSSLIIDNISTYIGNHQLAIGIGSPVTAQDVFDTAIAYLPIDSSNVTRVFKRQEWTSGIVCVQIGYKTLSHYTTNNMIYVCISNNSGGVSTVEPSGTNMTNVLTSDGYVWRYVGNLLSQDVNKSNEWCAVPESPVIVTRQGVISRIVNLVDNSPLFLTQPSSKIVTSTGTGANFVTVLDVDGSIKYVSCSAGGENYKSADYVMISDNFTGVGASVDLSITSGVVDIDTFTNGVGYSNISILVIGDGTGAILEGTIVAGSVTAVDVINGGTGYTWAKAFVFSSDSAAVAQVVIEPYNGVGYRLSNDLNSNASLISRLINIDGVVYDNMEFDYVSLTSNITNRIGSLAGNLHPTAINRESIVQDIFTVNTITPKTYSTSTSTIVQYIIENG